MLGSWTGQSASRDVRRGGIRSSRDSPRWPRRIWPVLLVLPCLTPSRARSEGEPGAQVQPDLRAIAEKLLDARGEQLGVVVDWIKHLDRDDAVQVLRLAQERVLERQRLAVAQATGAKSLVSGVVVAPRKLLEQKHVSVALDPVPSPDAIDRGLGVALRSTVEQPAPVELDGRATFAFQGLAAGLYMPKVRVGSTSYLFPILQVDGRSMADMRPLLGEDSLHVSLRNARGAPVPGAVVWARRIASEAKSPGGRHGGGGRTQPAWLFEDVKGVADEQGDVSFRLLTPGNYEVFGYREDTDGEVARGSATVGGEPAPRLALRIP